MMQNNELEKMELNEEQMEAVTGGKRPNYGPPCGIPPKADCGGRQKDNTTEGKKTSIKVIKSRNKSKPTP